jgi:nitrogen-specific signal transduction histidine kinase
MTEILRRDTSPREPEPGTLSLAMVAHDLRNEVQAAFLARDLLDLIVVDPRGREAVDILGHQLDRIAELVGVLANHGPTARSQGAAGEADVAEALCSAVAGRAEVVVDAPRGLFTTCP